ncbi:hypothetical protein [Actinokineospora iranica]|uniref:Uncharacterized protein n=1 Tax=Actinokineospora iranica TaxID=1271860 RepID=A0A1G6LQ50_9PSEU|nr:hypothetical protein [Actinokineospora iranica]SDC45319.1 hypothetical protein SAMN05216174_102186 [Actinokineospora iranica]
MTLPRAVMVALGVNGGPIEYRVIEDFAEITVGHSGLGMMAVLNLSVECVSPLVSVFEEVLPVLWSNSALIEDGRVAEVASPRVRRIAVGETCREGSERVLAALPER